MDSVKEAVDEAAVLRNGSLEVRHSSRVVVVVLDVLLQERGVSL